MRPGCRRTRSTSRPSCSPCRSRRPPPRSAPGRPRTSEDLDLPVWAGVLPLVTSPGPPVPRTGVPMGSTSLRPSPATTGPVGGEHARRVNPRLRQLPRDAAHRVVLFAGTFVLRLGSFIFPFLALYLTGPAGGALTGRGRPGHHGSTGSAASPRSSRGASSPTGSGGGAIALSMLTSAALVLLLLQVRRSRPSSRSWSCTRSAPSCTGRRQRADRRHRSSDHRVAAYAFNRLMFNLAWAIGLAVGGFVAERSFTALFIVDAATSAIFGVISLVALPHGTRTSKARNARRSGRRVLRDPRDRGSCSSWPGSTRAR